MNIGRLVLQEIRYRWLNFVLGIFSILAATACLAGAFSSLQVQEMRIQRLTDEQKTRMAQMMTEFEDSTRRNMLKLGFNVLIVHKDEDRGRLLLGKSPVNTLPESYVAALAGSVTKDGKLRDSGVLNLNHLLPILREDLVWENRVGVRKFVSQLGLNCGLIGAPLAAAGDALKLTIAASHLTTLSAPVILTGTPGEVPIIGKADKKPLIPVVPQRGILVGDAVRRAFHLRPGQDVELTLVREVRYGKELVIEPLPPMTFQVHRAAEVDNPRGNEHDLTIWINLGEAQQLLRKPEQITGIFALECVSPDCPGDRFHDVEKELADRLPGTQVVPFYSKAAVRATERSRAASLSKNASDRDIDQQKKLKEQHENFAAVLAPLVVLACMVWLGILAFTNVRERTDEIGILRALGVRGTQIFVLFLSKAVIVGLVGGLLGYAVGIGACSMWASFNRDRVTALQPELLALILLGAPLLGVLASLMPALWAARQDPAVILQQE